MVNEELSACLESGQASGIGLTFSIPGSCSLFTRRDVSKGTPRFDVGLSENP